MLLSYRKTGLKKCVLYSVNSGITYLADELKHPIMNSLAYCNTLLHKLNLHKPIYMHLYNNVVYKFGHGLS